MVEKAEKFLNFYSFYKLHKKLKDEKEKMIMLNLYTLLPNIPEKYYIKSRIAKINLLSSFEQENKSKNSLIKITDIIKDAILKNYNEIKSITTNVLEKYKDKIDSIEEKVNEINIKRSSIAQQPTNDKVTITILVINRIIKEENSHLIFPIEISINKGISYVDFCMKVIDIFQSILYTPKINYTELDNIIHIYKAKQNLNKTEMNLILFNAIFLFVYDINLLINKNYFSLKKETETFILNQDDCFIIDIYKNTENIYEKVPYYYKVCNLNCEYFAPLTNSILEFYQDMFYFLSSENKLQMLMRDEKGLQYNNRRINIPQLRNLGNICYFNSGLQCILNCTSFTKYFEYNYVSKDCLNVNFEQLPLTKALSNFITTLQDTKQRSVNYQPSVNDLYTTFIKKENKYADHSQHDSGEFISDFLNALDAELNRSSNYKKAAISEDNYLKSIQKYTNKNNSIIFDLFYGQMENIYKCDCKPEDNKCKCKDNKVNEFFLLFHVNIKVATKSFQAYLVDFNNIPKTKNFSLPLPETINIENICNDKKNGLDKKPMNYFICKVSKKTNTVTVITNPSTEIIKDEDVNDYVIYIYKKLLVEEKMFFHFIIVPTVIKEKRNWLKKAKDIYVPRDNTVNLDIKLYSHPFQIILPKDKCYLTSSWTGQYPNKLTTCDINYLYQKGFIFLKKVLANLRPSMKIKDINSISKSYSPFSLSVIFDDFLPLFFNLENYINEDAAPFDLGKIDNNLSVQVSTPTQGQILSLEECLLINSKYMNSLSKCKCNHKTQISIKITKLPLILIISLKKAKINEYQREVKLNNDVLYKKELNMFAYVNQDIITKEECDYELIGSVIHKGSTQCGHYTSIIKTKDKWILCDDDRLYTANNYYNNSSTILFYRKKVN